MGADWAPEGGRIRVRFDLDSAPASLVRQPQFGYGRATCQTSLNPSPVLSPGLVSLTQK